MATELGPYYRLRHAANHALVEALKANIRALAPTITSIAWENVHETGDDGRSFWVCRNIEITLSDGRVLDDTPDRNDMATEDLSHWLETVDTEGFPDELEKALEEGDDDALAIIGKAWFGLEDGATALPQLFNYIAQLIKREAASDEETALIEPALLADTHAEEAIALAIAHLAARPPANDADPTD